MQLYITMFGVACGALLYAFPRVYGLFLTRVRFRLVLLLCFVGKFAWLHSIAQSEAELLSSACTSIIQQNTVVIERANHSTAVRPLCVCQCFFTESPVQLAAVLEEVNDHTQRVNE